MQGLQHIITQAIDRSDLTVHRDSPLAEVEFQDDPLLISSDGQYQVSNFNPL
jgi:hypothetical protein